MSEPTGLLVAKSDKPLYLLPRMANRHGLIAGATGTGKTVSLQVLAEAFSAIGVPVFMADVKGDLAGLSQPGGANPKVQERVKQLKLGAFDYAGSPVVFWDIFGEQGHPARTTISEMGPLLLGRLFNLNEIQGGVLSLVFKIADDNSLLLLDTKDLRAMMQFAADNADQFTTEYGRISTASVGAIQRSLLDLETQGGDRLFGEPALNLDDFLQTDARGRGVVNILAADRLMLSPKLYATFLLGLLSDLYERMPEVGDLDKPKLVFFFDEAHLLFTDAPEPLLRKIEQIIRLIRSKGVGVYFVTQNPLDIPDIILGQLGNRIQHALRAFTPRDQKAVRAAAETLRANPKFNVEKAISELAVGEALVSFLDEKGQPGVVERAFVLPPKSQIGPVPKPVRDGLVQASVLYGHYEKSVDRDSAYEILKSRSGLAAPDLKTAPAEAGRRPQIPLPEPESPRETAKTPATRHRESMLEAMGKSAVRAMGSQIGRSIMRGVLGGILGGRR